MHTGREVLKVRDRLLPIIDMDKVLETARFSPIPYSARTIVIVEGSKGLFALRVQEVLGQVQIVLKPVGSLLDSSVAIAGAAILGDGKVALVIDIEQVIAGEEAIA